MWISVNSRYCAGYYLVNTLSEWLWKSIFVTSPHVDVIENIIACDIKKQASTSKVTPPKGYAENHVLPKDINAHNLFNIAYNDKISAFQW